MFVRNQGFLMSLLSEVKDSIKSYLSEVKGSQKYLSETKGF